MSTPGRFRLLAAIIEFFLNAGRGCGIIIPTHRDYPRRPAFVPYPAPAGYAFALILFFGRGRGRGGRATAKPTVSRRTSADGFAVKMKQTKAGAGLSNPVPRFRRRNGNGKNPDSQGGRVEIFCEAKNTTRPLTVWIVGTDIERGLF